MNDNDPNWILNKGYEGADNVELYVAAVYFTITTCTTVGYGDFSANNLVE